jgi:hypothetical protein
MRPTAAAPMPILITPPEPVLAPPDEALIVAVPEEPPALKVTIARPLASVSISDGSTVPSVVVKTMWVPE